MINDSKIIKIINVVILSLALFACSDNRSAEEFLQVAQESIKNKKNGQAIVFLKNAIKLEPETQKFRIALGKVYLSSGNYLNAEKEFDKAVELGVEIEQVSGMLAKIYSKLNFVEKSYELVDKGSSFSDQEYATLLLFAAITAYNNAENDRAYDFLEQAMVIDNNFAQVKLAKGYYNYSLEKYDIGLEAISSINKGNDFYFEAVLSQGHLLFAKGAYDEAAEKFMEFKNEVNQDTQVYLFLINSLISAQRYDEAGKYVDDYLSIIEDSAIGLFYKSKVEYHKEDYAQAKYFSERAIQINDKIFLARAVAGLSSFHLKNYEQSYLHLTAFEKHVPTTNNSINSILTIVKSKLGKTEGIDNLLDTSLDDAQILVNASSELIKLGHLKEAGNILNDNDVINTGSSKQLTQVGFLKLSIADEDGFTYLKKAIEKDPSSKSARMALVLAYYKAGDMKKALVAARQWQLEYPKHIESYNVIAKIKIESKEFEDAEVQLNKSLQIDTKNIYARLYFANKDISENNLKDALIKVNSILDDSPDHINALGLYYKIALVQKDTALAMAKIEAAYLKKSSSHVYKLFFASTLYISKDYQKCIEILNSWESDRVRKPKKYFELLIASHSNLEQYSAALEVNTLWLEQLPNDYLAWLAKLNTLDNLKHFSQATKTVEEMLVKFPEVKKLKVMLPYYQILNKQFKQAKDSLSTLDSSQYDQAFIAGLEGQILFSETQYQRALPKLEQQYNAIPNYRNTSYVYMSLLKLNQQSEAISFMEKHLAKFPDDMLTKAFYGQKILHVDLNKAKKTYLELVKFSPENVVFLNNLSWVEYSLNNFVKAKQYAEKANKLSPNHATILDSLALAYFKLGNIEQAKNASKKAKQIAPENSEIDKNYQLIWANE